MNNVRVVSTRYLVCGGTAIFLLGFILGAVLLLANFRSVMDIFRPDPEMMAERLANDIVRRLNEDFSISEESKNNIFEIVVSSQPQIEMIFEKTHEQVVAFRESIVLKISGEIPDEAQRKIFLEEHSKYFPQPPRPPHAPPKH